MPVTTEDAATPHITLHRHRETPSHQQQEQTAGEPPNSAIPLSSTTSFVSAVLYSPPSLPSYSIGSTTAAECSSPSPRKRSFSPQRRSPSPQSNRLSTSPLFFSARRTPPRSPGLRFSSVQHFSPPPPSQPQSSRALFTSKPYSPPRSPTLSPHRPITSLPCSPPQPTISPTLPSHGVNRHPPTVTTTPPHWSHPPTITTTPSPWSHPPTITPTPQSHSHPPSPGFNRSRDRHVKLAAVWSNSSGGSPQQQQHSPMRGLLSNITSPGANKVM